MSCCGVVQCEGRELPVQAPEMRVTLRATEDPFPLTGLKKGRRNKVKEKVPEKTGDLLFSTLIFGRKKVVVLCVFPFRAFFDGFFGKVKLNKLLLLEIEHWCVRRAVCKSSSV